MSSQEPATPGCAQCGEAIDEHDQYCRHCGEPVRHRRRDDRDRFPATWLLLLVVLALIILAFIAGLLINRADEDRAASRVFVCSRHERHHGHRCSLPGPATRPPTVVTGGALITNCSDAALVSSIKQLCSVELSNNSNVDVTVIEPLPGASSPTTPTTSGLPTPTPVPASPNLPG